MKVCAVKLSHWLIVDWWWLVDQCLSIKSLMFLTDYLGVVVVNIIFFEGCMCNRPASFFTCRAFSPWSVVWNRFTGLRFTPPCAFTFLPFRQWFVAITESRRVSLHTFPINFKHQTSNSQTLSQTIKLLTLTAFCLLHTAGSILPQWYKCPHSLFSCSILRGQILRGSLHWFSADEA